MNRYPGETRTLIAVDCIIFGFDGSSIKLLLIQRGLKPEKGKWSLMGGFLQPNEDIQQAADRVLKKLTGLEGVYMEQMRAFGDPQRDPVERTLSIAYFALIDIHRYEKQLSADYHAEWFHVKSMPELIFDHKEMVEIAKKQLRYKASLHPILFPNCSPHASLFPSCRCFTKASTTRISLNRTASAAKCCPPNYSSKQKEKDKSGSKKGAYFYRLDKRKYKANFHAFLNFIP